MLPHAQGPGQLFGTGHSPLSVQRGLSHSADGTLRPRERKGCAQSESSALRTVHGRFSRGAFPQFSREGGCTAMPPTEKNEPASGKLILFQRRYRRGESKISQEEAPHLEADLQGLGDQGDNPKAVARLPPPGGGGDQEGAGTAGQSQPGLPRRLTMTTECLMAPLVTVPPGPLAGGSVQPRWEAPCALPPTLPPRRPDSRNAGAALLTRVELGRGGRGPGGGQGGLGAQGAGQEGRCATWEGGGQTDTSEPAHRSSRLCLRALRLLQHAARTRAHRRASGVAPGVSVGRGGRKRSCKILG